MSPPESQVWLSLSAAPDAVVVTWVTPLGSAAPASIVQYDVTPGGFGRSATGNASSYTDGAYTSGRIHTATMPGLTAGAAYWYHLSGVNATWSATFTFAAPRGVGAIFPYRLGVVGDLGQTNNSNATIFAILGATPRVDSVVIAGDLSYADGARQRWWRAPAYAAVAAAALAAEAAAANHAHPARLAPSRVQVTSRAGTPLAASRSRSRAPSRSWWLPETTSSSR